MYILVFVIVLITVLYRLTEKMKEVFTPNVRFYTRQETEEFLIADEDGYVDSLTPMDLNKRNVQSKDDYIENIKESAKDFTDFEKKIIEESVIEAQEYLEELESVFIETELISSLNWNFSITENGQYEMGLPHTRSDVIFLTSEVIRNEKFVNTLIHEKIHVYQRVHKNLFQEALRKNGYEVIGRRDERKDLRSNPDLDEFMYMKHDKIYVGKGRDEHPNEEIAYNLEKFVYIE